MSFFSKYFFLIFFIPNLYLVKAQEAQSKFENEAIFQSEIHKLVVKNITDEYQFSKPEKIALNVKEIPNDFLNTAGYTADSTGKISIDTKDLLLFKSKIIEVSENNGFPFASISLINTKLSDDVINSYCEYKSGTYIVFDSLVIYGDVKIKKTFLAKYLELSNSISKKKEPFNQQKVANIVGKIKELPYLVLLKEPQIIFEYDKAIVVLYLEDKKNDSVEGVIGLLPNSSSEKKLQITGQLNLNLYNPFGSGKEIHLNWQRVKQASPIYNIKYNHPDFLNTGLKLVFKLNSLQEDSTFRNLEWELGVLQKITKKSQLTFSYLGRSHVNLDKENSNIENLPVGNAKISSKLFGISLSSIVTNNKINPICNWLTKTSIHIGTRRAFNDLNDTILNKDNLRYILKFDIQKSTRIIRNLSLVNNISAGLIGGGHIYQSEMFRVGGVNSLRGFAENSFFADQFFLLNNDIRFNMEENTYLFFFNDLAYLRQKDNNNNIIIPIGLGLGLSLSTKSGNLLLAFGFGKKDKSEILLRDSRFHFGYKAIF